MKICRLCFSIKVNNELICPLVSVRWKEQDSGPGLQFQVIKMLYCQFIVSYHRLWCNLVGFRLTQRFSRIPCWFSKWWSVTRWSCNGLRDCLREKTEIEFCSLLVCRTFQVGELVCPTQNRQWTVSIGHTHRHRHKITVTLFKGCWAVEQMLT